MLVLAKVPIPYAGTTRIRFDGLAFRASQPRIGSTPLRWGCVNTSGPAMQIPRPGPDESRVTIYWEFGALLGHEIGSLVNLGSSAIPTLPEGRQ